MDKKCLIWLVTAALAACTGNNQEQHVEPSDPMPKEVKLLSWVYRADVHKDTHEAIANGDYRLLAIPGRGLMIPGVDPAERADAKALCRIRYMTGMGDTLKGEEHRKLWKKARAYAEAYNKIMLDSCRQQK